VSTTEVGWIGAGRMGQAMVERLLDAGTAVRVWNRTAEKLSPLLDRGATAAATPAEAAAAGTVFSMVLDDSALDALWQGESGPLAAGSAFQAWIDCSTVSPDAAGRAASAASAAGVAFASAPVSGNPGAVRSGNAIFAVSGDSQAVEAARPHLSAMGRATYEVGSGRQASVVKLCTNAILGALTELLSEVLVLGEKSGVRRGDLMAIINDSAIGSTFSRYKTPTFVDLSMEPTFTPEGQRKDVRLALALARDTGTSMPMVALTEVLFSQLIGSGLGEGRDFAALIYQVARDSGLGLLPETS